MAEQDKAGRVSDRSATARSGSTTTPTLSPGKRTLTEALTPVEAPAPAFDRACRAARAWLDELEAAQALRDLTRTAAAEQQLSAALASAVVAARQLPATASKDAVAAQGQNDKEPDARGELARLEAASAAMLARASGASKAPPTDAAATPADAAAPSARSPQAIAAHGTAGPGHALPFLDAIQACFGRHDVSSIRAHTNGAAATSATDLGAKAFATGDQVAFAGAPDLHTAAHEAAHVVQQRSGVALKDGMGTAGDVYEAHADAVADLVVAGESAAPLLDQMAGAGAHAAPAAPAVQRKEGNAASAGAAGGMPAWDYIERHRVMALAAISERIAQTGLPQPHPRLCWADPALAVATVSSMIRAYAESAPGRTLKMLAHLSYPADMVQVVEQARNGRPIAAWMPEVGRAIAEAFDGPINTSIQRMGLRLRVQLDGDAHGVMPRGASLVASCPLDGVIADALVSPGVVRNQPAKADAKDTPGKPFAHGAVEVNYEWLGSEDPKLWNWIRVTSPVNATAEDVARTPIAGGEVMNGSEQAYRIAASPPYFGIPIETARLVKKAWDFAPDELKTPARAGDPGPRVADDSALSGRALSDDAALAQAGPSQKADLPPLRALERAEQQLAYLQERLAPWQAAQPLEATRDFLTRRADQRVHDPRSLQRWEPALARLQHTLFEISSDLPPLFESLEQAHARPDQAAALGPVTQLLRAYAHAAGVAHLAAQAGPALVEARRLRALLPIAMAEDRIRVARGTVAAQQETRRAVGSFEEGASRTTAELPQLSTRAADLRLRAARGEQVDDGAAADLAADADETTLRAEIALFQSQLATIEHRAIALHATATNPAGWTIERTMQHLRTEARGWLTQLDRTRDPGRTEGSSSATTSAAARAAGKRRTLEAVRAQMKHVREKDNVEALLQAIYKELDDQQLRNTINAMALQIGLMLVTGEVAGAGVAALRGVMMARELVIAGEVIENVRKVQVGYAALEMVSQAALQTAAQGATGGPAGAHAFGENLAGIALTSVILRPFQGLVSDATALEREVRTWAGAAKAGAKAAVMAPVEVGAGIVAAGTAHVVVTGAAPRANEASDVLGQGTALAVSKFVHGHVQEMRARITRATSGQNRAEAAALQGQLAALEAATATDAPPTLALARDYLFEHATLLDREAMLLQPRARVAETPAEHRAHDENAADQARLSGSFIEVSFRLAGLQPVVDGAVYEGTPPQIAAALAQADRSGMPPSRMRHADTRQWVVVSGDRSYTLHERGVVLAMDDARLRAAARTVPPLPGYIDIVVHGSASSFWVVRDGVFLPVDHRALATYAEKHGLTGQKIRLISCNSGASLQAIAQDLANKLGVEVKAPSKTAWINAVGEVGIGAQDVHDGTWVDYKPPTKNSISAEGPPRPRAKAPLREAPEELKTEDGSEVDGPLSVETPVVDNRAPVRFADFAVLTGQLGVAVVPDLSLGRGVQVRVIPRQGILGIDMSAIEVRVGPEARMSDVLGHAQTVDRLRRDTALRAKLRRLSDRFSGKAEAAKAAAATSPNPHRQRQYAPGTRGYAAQQEIKKLEGFTDNLRSLERDGVINSRVLEDEIPFLEGQIAYIDDVLQSMGDTGDLVDPSISIQLPDVGAVTREAKAAGYKLPGEEPGVGENADPEHYYYRRCKDAPSQFELARKPTAPADTSGYQVRVSGGRFMGLVEVSELGAVREVIPVEWTNAAVIARVRETSLGPYAAMLERHGIASSAVVDTAITTTRGRRNQQGKEVTLDGLRSEVKQYFRDRVLAKLLDPSLDARTSYRNMRNMVEGLNNADRGSLVQLWYTQRYGPTGKPQQKYEITRTTGGNQGKVETRIADLVVAGEIREIKDVRGKIDEDQFRAYIDVLRDNKVKAQLGADKLRYVFTRTEGAIANLERLAVAMGERDLRGNVLVEVIDEAGASHVVNTPKQAMNLLKQLQAHRVHNET